MNSKVTTAIFLALLFGIALLNILSPDALMSESENRYLQQKPSFSWDTLRSGKFTSDFEAYITDQFLWRDRWVGLKTSTEKTIGRRSSKGVYFAGDNWLMETFDSIDARAYERNLSYVKAFSDSLEDTFGIETTTMLVPSSSGVLLDKLPAYAPELDQAELLAQAEAALGGGFVNILPLMRSHSDDYIYYRTDHHWTSLGAFYAYTYWRELQGLPASDKYDIATLSDEFYGTTYSKARLYSIPPDHIDAWHPQNKGSLSVEYNLGEQIADSIYERSFLAGKDKYSVYLNGNQPITAIHTDASNGKRLLIIKDSYANTFVQFLTADYEEIVVVDLRFYREPASEIIRRENITDVLVLYSLKGFAADVNLMFLS